MPSELNFLDIKTYQTYVSFMVTMMRGNISSEHQHRPVAIMVSHLYENAFSKVEAATDFFDIVAVIPKASTRHAMPLASSFFAELGIPIYKNVFKTFTAAHGVPDAVVLSDPAAALGFLKLVLPENRDFILLDHGGYFAAALPAIAKTYGNRLLGVTEFTDNGHKKYERTGEENVAIVSIAHSPLKRPADKSAAQAIAFATEIALSGNFMEEKLGPRTQIGIIGYGRIGSNIAKSLKRRAGSVPLVYDINPLTLINAPSSGFTVAMTIEEILKTSDIIVSATGAEAIKQEHFALMKDGVCIVTGTSADDELDLAGLIKKAVLTPVASSSQSINTYTHHATGKTVHLLADGESPNTQLRAGVRDFSTLLLPNTAYLRAAVMIATGLFKGDKELQILPRKDSKEIAAAWLEKFHADTNF